MSKFMEVEDIHYYKVLINIDNILAVYRMPNGNCVITLATRSGEDDFYYEVENYEKIKEIIKIMEATK